MISPADLTDHNVPATPVTPDREELLIWRIMGRLETLALRKYELHLPTLATPEKRAVVIRLNSATDEVLTESSLQEPVDQLLAVADRPSRDDTLLIQGFVLERLGQVIYRTLAGHTAVSAATRDVASVGSTACAAVIDRATVFIRQGIGVGETLFERLCSSTDAVLRRLDALGTGVDQMFGERFGLTFSEVIGEFTADLLPACVALGINRRKLVCHLAGVFMGG